MKRKRKQKSKSVTLSVKISSALNAWVEDTAKRHGVGRDRVVESALKEFSSDRTLEDHLLELRKRVARIESSCKRIMVLLGAEL